MHCGYSVSMLYYILAKITLLALDQFMKERSHSIAMIVGKLFLKNGLNVHIKSVHEEKKPFKCDDCGAAFSRKSNLNRHIESVHERKKPFQCNICYASFSQKGDMNGCS